MANTTQAQISNIFNLMVQLEPRLNFYHFGWRSDILRNIDNNFDQGVKTGRLFPAVHFAVPEFTQFVDALQYESLKEEIEVTLYFDNLQDYNNTGATNTLNLLEQWDYLKSIAEDFVINLNFVLEHYNAGFISLPKFEQFSHGHNDRLISWRVTFKLTHYIECTEAQNQIDTSLLPATIEETDLENYKSQGPPPDRCATILGTLTQEDLLNCILPTYDFSDVATQNATTAQQQTDLSDWLCVPVQVNEYSIELDGVDEYISTRDSDPKYNIERTDSFTFSFWIKPTTLQEGNIINKFLAPTGYFIRLTANGEIRVVLANNLIAQTNSIDIRTATNAIVINQWQHVCITYNGSSNASGVKVYIDNALQTLQPPVGDTLSASISTAANLDFAAYVTAGRYYAGYLDEVRMWDIEFNATQVSTEYNGGSALAEVTNQINNFLAFGCGEGSLFGLVNRHFPDRLKIDILLNGFYYTQNSEASDLKTDIS